MLSFILVQFYLFCWAVNIFCRDQPPPHLDIKVSQSDTKYLMGLLASSMPPKTCVYLNLNRTEVLLLPSSCCCPVRLKTISSVWGSHWLSHPLPDQRSHIGFLTLFLIHLDKTLPNLIKTLRALGKPSKKTAKVGTLSQQGGGSDGRP